MTDDVSGVVKGPLKVLVVDSTGNAKGFEHEATRHMCREMEAAGIQIVGPVFADSMADVADATTQDFSAMLWVAHGSGATDEELSEVGVGEDFYPWQQVGKLGVNLDTKLAALCICSAGNDDMVVGLHESETFALMTIASDRVLTGSEAKAFFPALFKKLKPNAHTTIEPELVEEAVAELTRLANNKMKLVIK